MQLKGPAPGQVAVAAAVIMDESTCTEMVEGSTSELPTAAPATGLPPWVNGENCQVGSTAVTTISLALHGGLRAP